MTFVIEYVAHIIFLIDLSLFAILCNCGVAIVLTFCLVQVVNYCIECGLIIGRNFCYMDKHSIIWVSVIFELQLQVIVDWKAASYGLIMALSYHFNKVLFSIAVNFIRVFIAFLSI